MKKKEDCPIWIKLLRAASSLSLIGATTYIVFSGLNLVVAFVLVSSFGAIATPVVIAADSALEYVTGFFEVFVEGVLSVFEMIGNIIGSIFG